MEQREKGRNTRQEMIARATAKEESANKDGLTVCSTTTMTYSFFLFLEDLRNDAFIDSSSSLISLSSSD